MASDHSWQESSRAVLKEPAKAPLQEGSLLLGQSAGSYRERVVTGPLQRHFACAWFHAPRAVARGSAIVPDGCADLVFANGMLIVAGPDRRVKIESVRAGTPAVGLRFRPGVAPHWLGAPASEIVDVRVPLECLWGSRVRSIAEGLDAATTPEDVALRLEAALTSLAPDIGDPDEMPLAIHRFVGQNTGNSASLTQRLRNHFGLSERTLRRRCQEYFGYGPKTLDRILRFQRFIALARRAPFEATADLSVDAGYADQSHLTREAGLLAGLTPAAVRRQLA